MAGELFMMMTGVNLIHVPYRGGGPALNDLVGGQVQLTFEALPASIALIQSGKIRPLALTTATRSPTLPDILTIGDSVPGYEASGWFGLGTAKNTPAEIVDKLNADSRRRPRCGPHSQSLSLCVPNFNPVPKVKFGNIGDEGRAAAAARSIVPHASAAAPAAGKVRARGRRRHRADGEGPLRVAYATESGVPFEVLSDINISLRCGETVGLVGESGSGKSTTGMGMAMVGLLPALELDDRVNEFLRWSFWAGVPMTSRQEKPPIFCVS